MESYKYRQILLALREEYLKNEKRLEALKKYIQLNTDKELDEYCFYITAEGKNKYVELALRHRQSMILNLIQSLSNRIIGEGDRITIPIAHELNGEMRYITLPNSKIYEINDKNEFMAAADHIIGNKFTQNITTGKISLPEVKFAFRPIPSGILADTGDYTSLYTPARIVYSSSNDRLSIMVYDDPLYLEQANNIFNIDVPADILPKYHRDIIDNSEVKDKEIVIDGLAMTKAPQEFTFNEEDNAVVLRRAQKK